MSYWSVKSMDNKVKLTIHGTNFFINTDESVNYTKALGKVIDNRLNEILEGNYRLSMSQATILVALEMADAKAKAEKENKELREQLKGYLEESAKAKSERDYYKRENERIQTEAKFKNDQINLFANNKNDDE